MDQKPLRVKTAEWAKVFRPFEKVNRVWFFAIVFFWVILVLYIWSKAPQLLPGPVAVFKALGNFLSTKEFYSDIIQSIGLTLKAMILSIIIASAIAYLSVLPIVRPLAMFLVKLRYMSLVGFIFTFTLMLHDGGQVKIGLLMLGIIPFFVLSLLSVISKVAPEEYDLCITMKYSRWDMLYELIIFGRAEATIETIRTNFAMAWLMITLVESFSMSEGGIGVMLFRLNKFNRLAEIFALQIVIFGLGVLFDTLLVKLRLSLYPHLRYLEKKEI